LSCLTWAHVVSLHVLNGSLLQLRYLIGRPAADATTEATANAATEATSASTK
jgi:hypothetical protein